MYLARLTIENFRCFGKDDKRFEMSLRPGLTALVGENEAGKTAVLDALRFALGTTDQEWYHLEDTDFYEEAQPKKKESPADAKGDPTSSADDETTPEMEPPSDAEGDLTVKIGCEFRGLTGRDRRAFAEYLTYGETKGAEPVLHVNWTATDTKRLRHGRPYWHVDVHSGKDGKGPSIAVEVRELLRATYLRPLRDADRALSAGRGSRLAQILQNTPEIKGSGDDYDAEAVYDQESLNKLNVLGIGDLTNALLRDHKGVVHTRKRIDGHLSGLALHGDSLKSNIEVSGANAKEDMRLRQLLEKLNLNLDVAGKAGLGSNNLLFTACELLLLAEDEGNRMLLIEEPEAHLHAQRQLQVMKFMQEQAKHKGIQIIITTHSPNLASVLDLNSLVVIRKGRAFSLAEGETELGSSDYRFLERFLDVTKANLFFARGVMIVEGDSENILLPTLATLIDRDFTKYGVSVVNVGSMGLHRYARIFRRKGVSEDETDKQLDIPVACVTDMDVMPDCAPAIIGKLKQGDTIWPEKNNKRRWRAKRDIGDEKALGAHRDKKKAKASGQHVRTFVSDEWTLEYDLALGPKDGKGAFPGGLAEDIYIAACLADEDDAINAGKKKTEDIEDVAAQEFTPLKSEAEAKDACAVEEVIASTVYSKFAKDGVSKPIAAQYLANRLQRKVTEGIEKSIDLRAKLPVYLVQAIDYVTGVAVAKDEVLEKEARDE